MIPEELSHVLSCDPEIVSGAVCFTGTRVPVDILLDYISEGTSLDRFLQGFPGVKREQALEVLRWEAQQARRSLGLRVYAS